MGKKVLPIKYPTITSWQWQAGTFAILEANNKGFDWLYSNYIQLVSNNFSNTFNVDFIPRDNSFLACPLLNVQKIHRKLIREFNNSTLNFLKTCIDQNNYIYTLLDIGCILKDRKFSHDVLIYGYDDLEEVMYVADFIFKGKYSFEKVPYLAIINAYDNITDENDWLFGTGGVMLISVNNVFTYKFDTKLVKDTLIEYLESTQSMDKYRLYNNPFAGEKYGLQVYDMAINFCHNVQNGKQKPDFRALHNIYDHKVLMLNRLQYMQEHGYLSNCEDVVDKYSKLREQMHTVVMKFIKMAFKKDFNGFNSIVNEISNIKNNERVLISIIIEKIIHRPAYRVFEEKRH